MAVKPLSICIMPTFSTADDFLDTLYKAVWYVSPYAAMIDDLSLSLSPKLLAQFPSVDAVMETPLPFYIDPACMRLLEALKDRIHFVPAPSRLVEDMIARATYYMIWDEETYNRSLTMEMIVATMTKTRVSADRHHAWADGFTICDTLMSVSPWLIQDMRLGLQRFTALAEQVRAQDLRKAYVIGTGPSLQTQTGHDFSDGVSVVTASLLGNLPLAHHINPRLFCITDAIYQLGFTQYAAKIRHQMVQAMRELPDLQVFTRLQYGPLMRQSLPEDLHDRIIPCPILGQVSFNPDITQKFYTRDMPNVMTSAMLPAASSLAPSLTLLGCDGSAIATKDVWDYAPGANLTEEMQMLDIAHPKVRKRDNNAYLAEHNQFVADCMTSLEAAGRTVVSLTPSHIPAIQQRSLATPFPAE